MGKHHYAFTNEELLLLQQTIAKSGQVCIIRGVLPLIKHNITRICLVCIFAGQP